MISEFFAYRVGRAAGRTRRRREIQPEGYQEFEAALLLTAAGLALIWPIHFGVKLAQWRAPVALAVIVALIVGVLGLATGWGYVVIGFIYSGIWVSSLILRSQSR